MAYERNDYAGAAAATTLSAGINGSDTSISITASTGWPAGSNGAFVAVIDEGTASEEKVLVTTRTGTSLNTVTRGYDGTSATSHSSGATISHCIAAVDLDEANYWVAELAAAATAANDLIIADGDNSLSRIAKGSNSTVLQVSSGGTLQYGTVTSAMITDGTIAEGDIADGAIATAKIADSAITSAKIADGTITGTDIASGTVTSANLVDGTIVNADINASAAIALSKLATDPLARANHTGTQAASTISDFDTQVRTNRLDQMTAPTASVSMNSQKITSLALPTLSTDAVSKTYADTRIPTITGGTVGSSGSWSSGQDLLTITITDPGYDIEVWGWATVHFEASVSPSVWGLNINVDGSQQAGLVVPFVEVFAGVGISVGVPLKRTAHTTGTNCTIVIEMVNHYGGGTIDLGAPGGTTFNDYNYAEVQWRRNIS